MRIWNGARVMVVVGVLAAASTTAPVAGSTAPGTLVGWGNDSHGQASPPAGADHVAVTAGGEHGLALRSDGSIVGWGGNFWGQASPPAGTDYVAIAAGHVHSLALKSDGSIVGWGADYFGQASPPAGTDYVAVAAGGDHSLALRSDGSIVGWGHDSYGQASPPTGDHVTISAGAFHSLALRSDGSIVGWGADLSGEATPPAGTDYVAIAAGGGHSLALRSDGSIVGWGHDSYGEASPPAGTDYVAIAAGGDHSLALENDGSTVAWGHDHVGQASPPAGAHRVAIAAHTHHSLAIEGPHPPTFGEFTALTPARVLDTRHGVGAGGAAAPLGAGSSLDVQITGRGGVPAAGVQAVVMNVTAVDPTAWTYLSIYPTGITQPTISNLNTTAGNVRPNLVTVAVGDGGQVTVFNHDGSTHVLFDVAGYYVDDGPAGSRFRTIDPHRLADTRHGIGGIGLGPFGPGETRTITTTGVGGVPASGVTAVVLNVTVTQPTEWSYLTVAPADVARPEVSNLNYDPHDTVANQVIVRVPPDGRINLYNAFGDAHVIVDVAGYYETGGPTDTGRFIAFDPERAIDTRHDQYFPPPGRMIPDHLVWYGWIDDPYSATVVNVTVTDNTGVGYITTYPYPGSPPATSTVNYSPADTTVANHAIVACGPDMAFHNMHGDTHLIVDEFGAFT